MDKKEEGLESQQQVEEIDTTSQYELNLHEIIQSFSIKLNAYNKNLDLIGTDYKQNDQNQLKQAQQQLQQEDDASLSKQLDRQDDNSKVQNIQQQQLNQEDIKTIEQIKNLLSQIEQKHNPKVNFKSDEISGLQNICMDDQEKQGQQIIQNNNENNNQNDQQLKQLESKLDNEIEILDKNFGDREDIICQQREGISKLIQNEADNIILNYLFKRQNLVLSKFEEYVHKSSKAYNDQQNNYESLNQHVKGLIETQQKVIQRKEREVKRNPHIFDSTQNIVMLDSFEIKEHSKNELLDIYKLFESAQLLTKFEVIREICCGKDKHQDSTIISLGEVTLTNLNNQLKQYLICRGGDDRVMIIDSNTFRSYKTLELHQYSKRFNIRWIIQVENHILMQINSKFGDILIYEENHGNIVFRKVDHIRNQSGHQETTLKPILMKVNGRHFLNFASSRSEVYLVYYDKREMLFEVMHSLKPLDLIQGQNQTNKTNISNNPFDIREQGDQSLVLCLKELQLNNALVIGYMNKGLQIIDLNFDKNRLTLRNSILNGFSIKDVIEIDANQLLVLTYNPPTYFRIDIQLKKVTPLGDGPGKQGLSLTKLPGYHPQRYPFILSKENDAFYIVNPISNNYCKVLDMKPYQTDSMYLEDNVIFDRENPYVFYTDKSNFYITRYEINPTILQAFKCYLQ